MRIRTAHGLTDNWGWPIHMISIGSGLSILDLISDVPPAMEQYEFIEPSTIDLSSLLSSMLAGTVLGATNVSCTDVHKQNTPGLCSNLYVSDVYA